MKILNYTVMLLDSRIKEVILGYAILHLTIFMVKLFWVRSNVCFGLGQMCQRHHN